MPPLLAFAPHPRTLPCIAFREAGREREKKGGREGRCRRRRERAREREREVKERGEREKTGYKPYSPVTIVSKNTKEVRAPPSGLCAQVQVGCGQGVCGGDGGANTSR